MKPSTTSLPGVILLDPDPHTDARGTLISERASVRYKLTAAFDPADDRAVRGNDPAIARLTEPVLSPNHAVAPLLANAELPPLS